MSPFLVVTELKTCDASQLAWARDLTRRFEKNLNGFCRSIRSQRPGDKEMISRGISEATLSYGYHI